MPWPAEMSKRRVAGLVVAAIVVMGAVVGALGGSDTGDHEASTGVLRQESAESFQTTDGGAGSGSGPVAASGGTPSAANAAGDEANDGAAGDELAAMPLPEEPALAAVVGERIVKTANLEVEVEEGDLDSAAQEAERLAESFGGFVQSSKVSDGQAVFTLRVPAADFSRLLREARELGEVRSETVTGEDVSEEFVDLEARLRHWRAQEAVFLDLMARATTVTETIEVRRELSAIQETIEKLEGRRRFLEDRVSLSTLTLTLDDPAAGVAKVESEPEPGTLSKAWDDAIDAAEAIVAGTIVVLGALIPLSAIGGVIALAVWLVVRRRGPEPTGGPATPTPSAAG